MAIEQEGLFLFRVIRVQKLSKGALAGLSGVVVVFARA
jgi:hypothetical protein